MERKMKIIEDQEQSLDDLVKRARDDSKLKNIIEGGPDRKIEHLLTKSLNLNKDVASIAANSSGTQIAIALEHSLLFYQHILFDESSRLNQVNTINSEETYTSVGFSKSGELIAAGTKQGNIYIYSSKSLEPITLIKNKWPVNCLCFNDTELVAGCTEDSNGKIVIFDNDTFEYKSDILHDIHFYFPVAALAFDNNMRAVAWNGHKGGCVVVSNRWQIGQYSSNVTKQHSELLITGLSLKDGKLAVTSKALHGPAGCLDLYNVKQREHEASLYLKASELTPYQHVFFLDNDVLLTCNSFDDLYWFEVK
jgi:WD40 repeat protein